ncbi:P-loop NTPase family protein [Pseudosulfitobacter pseudonitzschiae]|uniref:hypothetical protein n=1 Tax=Pseudosulfitobacter pseudonitzschiae TaxID=1402135 RepID=UPI001CD43A14|nr:hypothetical protein [Pseudosulfitobacter pseudonitzschiae]
MLELNNVEVTYSMSSLALKGVSMNVREGQCVALLGGNGAEKHDAESYFRHVEVGGRNCFGRAPSR